MRKNRALLTAYMIGHFTVDFACAFLLYQKIYVSDQWYLCLLIYNFCAFALQMPVGLLADKLNRNALCAASGCGLVVLAYLFGDFEPIAVVIAAGIGNAMFHIGGGIDVLNDSREKSFRLGLFVSPGALGIYLGTLYGKKSVLTIWLVVLTLLVVAIAILVAGFRKNRSLRSENVPVSLPGITSPGLLFTAGCLLAVVILRSYIGMNTGFAWKSQGIWGSLFLTAVVLGKLSGGFVADRIGVRKATLFSLGFAALLFLFSGNPVSGTMAIFFFNMTMPITLWVMARYFQGCKGFSFGLLTFGLFIGFLPDYFELNSILTSSFGFTLASMLSLILLWTGLRKAVA